ncbi:MAG: hypothetical protein MK212_18975, partial [Saprospiraceae bacterium]|nr:hypothetical protein [Saprospiraceae bacterium]
TQASKQKKATSSTDEKAAKAKAKRWQDRLSLMQNGISELEQWLGDLIRQGFANVNLMEPHYWDQVASKMTNAKLSGLSTQLKEISEQVRRQEDWIEQLALSLGGLYIQIQAFNKREHLPPLLLEHLYSTLGRNLRKNDVIELNLNVTDQWIVMGKKEGIDVEGRSYRRVWLKGIHQEKYALILDYAFGNKSYEQQFLIGSILQATVYYYPAQTPMRAIIKQFELLSQENYPVFTKLSFQDFLNTYAHHIAQTPWLKQFPVYISDVIIRKDAHNHWLLDRQGFIIPTEHLKQATLWKLMALSGGDTITVFGEWDGSKFTPLSVLLDQRIINL